MKEISCEVRKPEELEGMFLELTSILMNECELSVGEVKYRIVECEVYYHEPNKHSDPYAHQVIEQLKVGNWYFNGFGLDLTFGNEKNKIYGGILLRAIKRLKDSKCYNGPSLLLKEIFSKLGSIDSKETCIYISEKTSDYEENSTWIATDKRIGLTIKKEDIGNKYLNKEYRFIADLIENKNLKNKTKAIESLIDNKLSKKEFEEIFGYLPSNKK
jgi:hypothetical protein